TQMQPVSDTVWEASIETPAHDEVLQWRLDLDWSVGTVQSFPSNRADPLLERYYGPVLPLYCTGFENPDEIAEWELSEGFDVRVLDGANGAGDPEAAYEGDMALTLDLGAQGKYGASSSSSAVSPAIDTQGYSKVRLQYYRELDVEDGYF